MEGVGPRRLSRRLDSCHDFVFLLCDCFVTILQFSACQGGEWIDKLSFSYACPPHLTSALYRPSLTILL